MTSHSSRRFISREEEAAQDAVYRQLDPQAIEDDESEDATMPAPSAGTATRELDAMIAERVMGAKWETWSDYVRSLILKGGYCAVTQIDGRATVNPACPRYSSFMGSAWDVHREMCDRPFSVRQRYLRAIQEQATTDDGANLVAWPDVLVVLRHRFPEAICKAALVAMEPNHV